jgi:NADPH2:quinone reductase
MKAIRIHKHGGVDVLQIDEISVPQPKKNEVLIKIKTAGLNHLDLWVRKGIPGLRLPLILGSDGAGVIDSLGSGINSDSGYQIGDEVFLVPFRTNATDTLQEELSSSYQILGEHLDGTQAEYVSAPIEYIMPKPERLTWEEAAAFPLAYMTAFHMLKKKVQLKEGQDILIWGASSGIGSAAIQLAKLYGATVITTSSTDTKKDFAERLGADYVINYREEDVSKRVREITAHKGVHVVFDHIGVQSWSHSLRSLKKGGRLVICGSTTGPMVRLDLRLLYIKHQHIIGSTMGNRQDLTELSALIDQRKIDPIVGTSLSYKDIRQAHQILEGNKQMGKVVICF